MNKKFSRTIMNRKTPQKNFFFQNSLVKDQRKEHQNEMPEKIE